ncbi:MAG: hypothetical protein AAGB06_05040 [Verrucomicrobiota bacterium]
MLQYQEIILSKVSRLRELTHHNLAASVSSVRTSQDSEGKIRTTLIGKTWGPIKKLQGFQKRHFVPDNHSDATQSFVRNVGGERIQQQSEALYQSIRLHFELKRKQLHYLCEGGYAQIESPHFIAEFYIDQDPADPAKFLETAQVIKMKTEGIAQDTRFHSCFNTYCDCLKVEFAAPLDLEQKIDDIEEIPLLESSLSYAPDASSVDLKLREVSLHIHIRPLFATFKIIGGRDLSRLLDHSQKTLELLAPAGFPKRIYTP